MTLQEAKDFIAEELRKHLRRFTGLKNTPAMRDQIQASISQILPELQTPGGEIKAEVNPNDPSQIIVTMQIPIPTFVCQEFDLEPGTTMEEAPPETQTKIKEWISRHPEYDWDW